MAEFVCCIHYIRILQKRSRSMKASNLSAVWDAPDNSRLMKKQTSVRLATHIEARLSAICAMFPAKSKSQVINDLLSAALPVSGVGDMREKHSGHMEQVEQHGTCLAKESEPLIGMGPDPVH